MNEHDEEKEPFFEISIDTKTDAIKALAVVSATLFFLFRGISAFIQHA